MLLNDGASDWALWTAACSLDISGNNNFIFFTNQSVIWSQKMSWCISKCCKCPCLSSLSVDTRKVYGTVVDKQHHLVRKDGRPYSDKDFAENPHEYKATFFEKVRQTST